MLQGEYPNSAPVAVIICAYADERYGDLCRAIASLESQSLPAAEVVVAVDRNDALLARVRSDFPDVKAVANTQHPGAGGARNSGVAVATTDFVAFIDDDCIADPSWLENLLPAVSRTDVLGGGGSIRPLWPSQRPTWFPEEFNWAVGGTYLGLPTMVAPVRNVFAGNMIVRRDVFVELGGFLAGFGKQGSASEPEETEFCIRASQRWPTRSWIYVPHAGVQHRVLDGRETWRYFLSRCLNEGRGKARMSGHVQAGAALASERRYVTRILPRGVLRGLATGLSADRAGFAQAWAIVVGLGVTVCGYTLESRRVLEGRRIPIAASTGD